MNFLLLIMMMCMSISFSLIQTPLRHSRLISLNMKNNNVQEVILDVPLGYGFKNLECKFKPIFSNSKFIIASYDVPFDINIDKPPKGFPAPVVTKDGKGGEMEGDALRAVTCWSQGFSAAGVTSDIAMFAGK